MGFFGDVSRTLFGGSKTDPTKLESGFGMLPSEITGAYTGYAGELPAAYSSGMLEEAYRPEQLTDIERGAIGDIETGLAPTPESLEADISMLMNPFEASVIDPVQREAAGEFSILKQALQEAGQVGSSRAMLGASDIEERRLGTIGRLRQSAYEKALDAALGDVAGLRREDIGMKMGVGELERGIAERGRAAPATALQTYGGMLGALPTTAAPASYGGGGTTSTGMMPSITGAAKAYVSGGGSF